MSRATHSRLSIYPTFLRIPSLSDLILRPWQPRGNKIPKFAGRRPGNSPKGRSGWSRSAETCSFAMLKAHLYRRRLSHLVASSGHAGAGGARNRAISDRISANICRGTVTSASWKVT
jgi:hypothetical protein